MENQKRNISQSFICKEITILLLMVLFLIITAGCSGNSKSNSQKDDFKTVASKDTFIKVVPRDTFITVDVSKKYPKKELMLQDIMDVEYIALESTDEFVCQGVVLSIGKEIILIKNSIDDGNIYLFDRNGKGLRKINRRGQGPEEYVYYMRCFLDEDNSEIYMDELIRGIKVYDLQGNFLRNIDKEFGWNNKFIFNSEYLIGKEYNPVENDKPSNNQRFAFLSKQDGSVLKDFRIYFEKRVVWGITTRSGNAGTAPRPMPIIPYHDSWLLMEPSCDTVFRITPDYSLMPFIARTPPIQSMKPGIFLLPCIFTDDYYFMETVKMEYDLSRDEGFPKTKLAYDRMGNTIFEYTVVNDDFREKGPVNMTWQETTNNEIAYLQVFEAYELFEANGKGQLKGKLKEVTEHLDDDPNPVIMLVKYKQ